MANTDPNNDEVMQRLGERIIRNVQARVSAQVPAPGRNPFSKGVLQKSVKYSWTKNPQTEAWELKIDYADQGTFTQFGTRAYFNPATVNQSMFGYDFRGFVPGKGGVRPQFWLSLRGDQPVYEAIIEAEIRKTWEFFVKNTVTGLAKQNE